LIVNVIGTAVAGHFAYQRVPHNAVRAANRSAFWITGFAGGLTTFSSLSFFVTELPALEAFFFAGLNLFISMALLAAIKHSNDSNDSNDEGTSS
jgi:fluoride ion exporter CrcB/FEX